MKSLNDVWEEALKDRTASNLNTPFVESRMNLGYKIIKSGISIRIFETFNRPDFYTEIPPSDYKLFKEKGWLPTVFELSLLRCGDQINKLNAKIESNGDIESHYSKSKLQEIEEIHKKIQSILKRKQSINEKPF